MWRRRRIRGDRLATPSPHCAAARQAQFLVSITIGQSIYCIFAIDTTDVLWYNPFVIDSMCVSSPAGGQARLSGLGAKGFALHTLQDSLALLEKQQGCSARRFLGLFARAGGWLAPVRGSVCPLALFIYISWPEKAERSVMSQLYCTGRVTSELELKTSAKKVPYLNFPIVEYVGYGRNAHPQYLSVWAWGATARQLVEDGVGKGSVDIRLAGAGGVRQKRRRNPRQAAEAQAEGLGIRPQPAAPGQTWPRPKHPAPGHH